MRVKVVAIQRERPAASNLTAKEFLAEAHQRFPEPSEFMEDFLRRFEALIEFEQQVDDGLEMSDECKCPVCGTELNVEEV